MTFCSRCGAENKDNANFCMKCGNSVSVGKLNINQSSMPPMAWQETKQITTNGRSSIVAALLNLSWGWGLGYNYVGIKKVCGLPWYSLVIIQCFLIMLAGYVSWIFILLLPVGSFAFAYDVYQKASSKPGFIPIDR